MKYVLEHGDVWLAEEVSSTGSHILGPEPMRHVCSGTELLALAFDRENGTLHKTGSADSVEKWASATCRKLRAGGATELADDIVVISFPVCRETVEEINLCRDYSGRVLGIEARLAAIGEKHPELPHPYVPR